VYFTNRILDLALRLGITPERAAAVLGRRFKVREHIVTPELKAKYRLVMRYLNEARRDSVRY